MDYKYEYEKIRDILKHIQEEHRIEMILIKLEYENRVDCLQRKFNVASRMLEDILINCEK